jgi:3-oxoacyl-[acyl-carrier-protein] synthase II
MNRALTDAQLSTKDIFHVSAHATSTPAGDVAEAKAIRKVLGSAADHAPVTAVKGAAGHLLGGAGSLAAIASILAIKNRIVPPVCNLDNLADGVDVDVVIDKPRELPAGDIAALSNSFGFGGHDIVLAFRNYS